MMEMPANTWEGLFSSDWASTVDKAPELLQEWLLAQGSLTEKLTAACQSDFNVELLHQTLSFATEAAAAALGVDEGSTLLHREVLLKDGDKPLVFACSLLPEVALSGRFEELRQLDERPLGQWIFAEPALQRSRMGFAVIPADAALFVRLPEQHTSGAPLWGRATYFSGAAAPLLVSEFFLNV